MCLQVAGRNRINMPSFFNCFLEQLGCETFNDVCLFSRAEFPGLESKIKYFSLECHKVTSPKETRKSISCARAYTVPNKSYHF